MDGGSCEHCGHWQEVENLLAVDNLRIENRGPELDELRLDEPLRLWAQRRPGLGDLEVDEHEPALGARCLSRRTEKGKAYGVVTAKALAVLEALLWGFHNARPSSDEQ
jgi:hypothetical protein